MVAVLEHLTAPAGFLLAAIIGLAVWRYQLIAKRRYEVAEQALTIANGAAVTLRRVRGAKAAADLAASLNPDALRPEPWFATYSALQNSAADFENLDRAAKSIAMHFGDLAAQPFFELLSIHGSLWAAQSGLYHVRAADKRYDALDQGQQWDEWKRTLNQQPEGDALAQQIDMLERTINSRFGMYLRPGFWRLFLPSW